MIEKMKHGSKTPFIAILEGEIQFWKMLNLKFLTCQTSSPDLLPLHGSQAWRGSG